MTNETRRIKTKLKLFEQEGFTWAIGDILEQFCKECPPPEIVVESLKQYYLRQIEGIPSSKQGELWQK